jgi:hypothetical protein
MNFQYICTFNSDKLPTGEFSKGFDIASFTRLRLTDETEDGGLLGIRLPSAATRAPKSSSKSFDLLRARHAGAISAPSSGPARSAIPMTAPKDEKAIEEEEDEYDLFRQNPGSVAKKLV